MEDDRTRRHKRTYQRILIYLNKYRMNVNMDNWPFGPTAVPYILLSKICQTTVNVTSVSIYNEKCIFFSDLAPHLLQWAPCGSWGTSRPPDWGSSESQGQQGEDDPGKCFWRLQKHGINGIMSIIFKYVGFYLYFRLCLRPSTFRLCTWPSRLSSHCTPLAVPQVGIAYIVHHTVAALKCIYLVFHAFMICSRYCAGRWWWCDPQCARIWGLRPSTCYHETGFGRQRPDWLPDENPDWERLLVRYHW